MLDPPATLYSACRMARASAKRCTRRGGGDAQAQAGRGPEGTVRRRPPGGWRQHSVGSEFEFRVEALEEGGQIIRDHDAQPDSTLERIVWTKEEELSYLKERIPLQVVQKSLLAAPSPRSFTDALLNSARSPALIAEVKKASPSKGVFQADYNPVATAEAYEQGGAACCSVLTDSRHFHGSFEHLLAIRSAGVSCPLLCKDFVLEAYQLAYARSKGADAALLIASVLPTSDLDYLNRSAHKLGLQTLLEVHSLEEMDRALSISTPPDMLGINNRDLSDFSVSLSNTSELLKDGRMERIRENGSMVVAESGIATNEDVLVLQQADVDAILVGERLTRHSRSASGEIAELYGDCMQESESIAATTGRDAG